MHAFVVFVLVGWSMVHLWLWLLILMGLSLEQLHDTTLVLFCWICFSCLWVST